MPGDPLDSYAKTLAQCWAHALNGQETLLQHIATVWQRVREAMAPANNRWIRAKGPITALVAHLLDWGVDPVSPSCFRFASGARAGLEAHQTHALARLLPEAAVNSLWLQIATKPGAE